jgi:glycosyltransferase involved in cell wall biosynthesis
MHVVMLSDAETRGGAGIAASRLAEALHRSGHRVTRLVHLASGQVHEWTTVSLGSPSWIRGWTRKTLPSQFRNMVEMQSAHKRLGELIDTLSPDVVNVHNLHGYGARRAGWSAALVQICANHVPTVWTLHDMWSFTGRCAYSYNCRKFLTGCDATCPTPTEHPALAPKKIAPAWEARRQLFSTNPSLVAVAPSRWMGQQAQAGLWASHRVEVIPYGLPLNVYRPLDRGWAREALGLRPRGPVLLLAADDLTERRKGMQVLLEALPLVSRPLTLLTMGSGSLTHDEKEILFFDLGYVQDEQQKVLAYNAADILVHPAPVDNLPVVVMESIACGTPVVAFPIGGLPDLVRAGETGWMADTVSAQALASAIRQALEDLERGPDLRPTCRRVAETEFDMDLQARRYLGLYHALTRNVYSSSFS